MTPCPSPLELLFTIDALFGLTEKWPYYLPPEEKNAYYGELSQLPADIEYAAKLWLLDFYVQHQDYADRLLIKARKTTRKYPETLNRSQVKEAILFRLERALRLLHELPGKSGYMLVQLPMPVLEKAREACVLYFADSTRYFQMEDASQKDILALKLSGMFVEHAIPA